MRIFKKFGFLFLLLLGLMSCEPLKRQVYDVEITYNVTNNNGDTLHNTYKNKVVIGYGIPIAYVDNSNGKDYVLKLNSTNNYIEVDNRCYWGQGQLVGYTVEQTRNFIKIDKFEYCLIETYKIRRSDGKEIEGTRKPVM